MKKYILAAALALLTFVMVAFTASNTPSQPINQLYIFGDSLSDIGNVFRTTAGAYPPSPPYYQGRYSNGPVWVEHLASQLTFNPKQNVNLAYGGATTGGDSFNGVPGLLAQVNSFNKSHQHLNPNAFYILWAGANDYLYGTANSTTPVANISAAIQSLSTAGARKILIANLPDLGNLPATRNSGNSQTLNALTSAHNLGLAKSLDALHQKFGSNTQIIELNVNSLYKQAISQPAKFGFTNVTAACLYNRTSCDNPDNFLFWDGIHPTTAAHRILAEAAFKSLKNEQSLQVSY